MIGPAPKKRLDEAMLSRVPPAWRDWIGIYHWRRRRTGMSGADVFHLEASGHPALFVKIEPDSPFSEARAEALRLQWLRERGVACPACREFQTYKGRNWLVTTALAGCDLASLPRGEAAGIVRIVADVLLDLHARPIRDCPFDQSLPSRIAQVSARLAAGAIDESEFEEEGGAAEALAKLLTMAPSEEDLVLTHGDACLPNFLFDKGNFSGFVDCGRAGIADRYQDLALASDSISENLGEAWVGPFLAHYGLPAPDSRRLAFYQRLDAFF